MSQKRTLPNLLMTALLFAFMMVATSAVAMAQLKFDGFTRDTDNYCNGVFGSALITITKTDGTPPTDLQPCDDAGGKIEDTITSDRSTGYFCFLGPEPAYDLVIQSRLREYRFRWVSDDRRQKPGVYDIREFGGVGDGSEFDNTYALKSAAAFIGSHIYQANAGGVLIIPNGFFKVMGTVDNDLPAVIPPGMTIQGINGRLNIPSSRLQLQVPGKTILKIGGCTDKVTMRDMGFYGTLGGNSRAIAAEGYAPQSSQDFVFSSIAIQNFDIGIEVLGLDSDKGWQFDFIKVDNSRITADKIAIHIDTINSDWQISNTNVAAGPNGTALLIDRVGVMEITNMFGGGGPNNAPINPALLAKAFIWFRGDNRGGYTNIGSHSTINIQNSECEGVRNSILYDMQNIIYDYFRSPIKISHSGIGAPVRLRADVNLVSLGNIYYSDTVRTVRPGASDPESGTFPGSTKTQIYSFGDQFLYRTTDLHNCPPFSVGSPSPFPMETDPQKCVRDFILDNTGGLHNRVVVRTSQVSSSALPPCDPSAPGNCSDWSAYDTLYNKMEGTLQNGGDVLPSADDQFDMGNDNKRWRTVRGVRVVSGDTVLSDRKTGKELYKIHEDAENIYFSDIRTGKTMMRLDRHGNLFVTGKVISNSKPKAVQSPNRRRRTPARR